MGEKIRKKCLQERPKEEKGRRLNGEGYKIRVTEEGWR